MVREYFLKEKVKIKRKSRPILNYGKELRGAKQFDKRNERSTLIKAKYKWPSNKFKILRDSNRDVVVKWSSV